MVNCYQGQALLIVPERHFAIRPILSSIDCPTPQLFFNFNPYKPSISFFFFFFGGGG